MDVLHDATFPTATDSDLLTAVGMLREKYARFFPQVNYQRLEKGTIPSQEGDVADLSPATSFDDLWGEAIPPGMQPGLDWQNPHADPALDATEGGKYTDVGPIHVHLNHEPTEKELSRFGIDQKNLMTATFLVSLLDDLSLTVKFGDRFHWKTYMYEVKGWRREGYWKNTSVHLYIVAACTFKRYGS